MAVVELENAALWRKFSCLGTEMIITRSGRRLFPTVRVRVGGLITSRNYVLLVDVMPVDQCRYRYEYSTWFVSEADHSRRSQQDDTRHGKHAAVSHGQTQPRATQAVVARPRCYVHPDSPTTGDYWMKQSVISFHRLKLTNNISDLHGNIIVSSLRKYRPRVFVVAADDVSTALMLATNYQYGDDNEAKCHVSCHVFPETEFIAVTAYQNEAITQLKIDQNPFARGFRYDGRAHRDRSQPITDYCSDQQHKGDVTGLQPTNHVRLQAASLSNAAASPSNVVVACLQSSAVASDGY